MKRRQVVKNILLGGTAIAASPALSFAGCESDMNKKLKGNISHSVCYWTYNFLPLDELCTTVKKIGFSAIDLVGPKDWPTLKKYGIFSSMCNGAEINLTDGWNHKEYHSTLIKNYSDHINYVADAGYKNLICLAATEKEWTMKPV